LARSPFIYRKAGNSPFVRELIVPLRTSGYVVPYEIEGGSAINVLAVRHQLGTLPAGWQCDSSATKKAR
jgi:hypothetical protein